MEMTYERAAEILDPEHLENYSIETVKEACRIGMDAFKFLSTPSARRATSSP